MNSVHATSFLSSFKQYSKTSTLNSSIKIGSIMVGSLFLMAVVAPFITPYSPFAINLPDALAPVSIQHLFGTDELGRDILSRLIYGTRYTLYIVCLVTVLATPLGLIVGIVSGYFGGWIDTILMRITDIFLTFPRFILALALVAALGPGLENAIIAIALTSWTSYARLVRAQTLQIRSADYIKASRMLGASNTRILFIHIIPMCLPNLLVRVSLDLSGVILSAAGLGFLGLGAQPPAPEWGTMLASGTDYIMNQWWIITFPGFAIFYASLGFNLLGDGLRDLFDTKLKTS